MSSYNQLSFTEQSKSCAHCKQPFSLSEFYRDKRNRDGLGRLCKSCAKASTRAWVAANKDYCKVRDQAYAAAHRDERAAANRAWREANSDRVERNRRTYYQANRERIAERDRAYRLANLDEIRARRKRYYALNRDQILARQHDYYMATRDVRLAHDKAYRVANSELIRSRNREAYWANRDARIAQMLVYRDKPGRREMAAARAKEWRDQNRDRFMASIKDRKYRLRTASQQADTETNAFLTDVRRDSCSYCGKAGGTVDHIVPLANGGLHNWSNLAGACLECNMRKKTMSALTFLYRDNRRSAP